MNDRSDRSKRTNRSWSLTSLEPRVLLAGDVGAAGVAFSGTGTPGDSGSCVASFDAVVSKSHSRACSPNQATMQSMTNARSVVFVDARVQDLSVLLDGLDKEAELVFVNTDSDGLGQITRHLKSRVGIRSIHVVSHGASGELRLGRDVINANTLSERSPEISQWAGSLTSDADILIYACELGAGASGLNFAMQLAGLSGADVATSTDMTGNGVDADWHLERSVGVIESSLVFDVSSRREWRHVLSTDVVTRSPFEQISAIGVFTAENGLATPSPQESALTELNRETATVSLVAEADSSAGVGIDLSVAAVEPATLWRPVVSLETTLLEDAPAIDEASLDSGVLAEDKVILGETVSLDDKPIDESVLAIRENADLAVASPLPSSDMELRIAEPVAEPVEDSVRPTAESPLTKEAVVAPEVSVASRPQVANSLVDSTRDNTSTLTLQSTNDSLSVTRSPKKLFDAYVRRPTPSINSSSRMRLAADLKAGSSEVLVSRETIPPMVSARPTAMVKPDLETLDDSPESKRPLEVERSKKVLVEAVSAKSIESVQRVDRAEDATESNEAVGERAGSADVSTNLVAQQTAFQGTVFATAQQEQTVGADDITASVVAYQAASEGMQKVEFGRTGDVQHVLAIDSQTNSLLNSMEAPRYEATHESSQAAVGRMLTRIDSQAMQSITLVSGATSLDPSLANVNNIDSLDIGEFASDPVGDDSMEIQSQRSSDLIENTLESSVYWLDVVAAPNELIWESSTGTIETIDYLNPVGRYAAN